MTSLHGNKRIVTLVAILAACCSNALLIGTASAYEMRLTILKAANSALCHSMALKGMNSSAVVGESLDDKWTGPLYLQPDQEPNNSSYVEMQDFDLLNTGVPQRVYWVDSGSTFSETFFVVTPKTVAIEEVKSILRKAGFSDMPQFARYQGWMVVGWQPAPFGDQPFHVTTIKGNDGNYLLATSDSGHRPFEVLWKPRPNGELREICVFKIHRVPP